MSADKLALLGGSPVRTELFAPYPVLGEAEKQAVIEVIESGHLSQFAASMGAHFLGGQKIRKFEDDFAAYHGTAYAVTCNSATAGLHMALAAAGVGPGDEVIVPPYTFTATASAVVQHNAIPVFVDVDPDYYCMMPEKIEAAITPQTKVIMPVHLLGQCADMDPILEIAARHNLLVIEDCAQAPGARYKGRLAGTMGAMGVFSFQESKNVATGEGGMVITNDDELALRCRMIRNHGEVIIAGEKRQYLANIIGWNYRMTELEAAVGIVQFSKLDEQNRGRVALGEYLSEQLRQFDGITPPAVAPHNQHTYHIYGMKVDCTRLGVPRAKLVAAMNAEGLTVGPGYPHPLYKNPLFCDQAGYGKHGCPFTCGFYKGRVNYADGLCPNAEKLCYEEALWIYVVRPPSTRAVMDEYVAGFRKVLANKEALNNWEAAS